MPFTKVGKDDYTSPSGRHFNGAQVRLYYAGGDKFPGEKSKSYEKGGSVMKKFIPSRPAPSGGEKPEPYSKGEEPRDMDYAKGGPVLGRQRDFMKSPNEFSQVSHGTGKTDETFGKGSKGGGDTPSSAVAPKRTGDKSEKAVKPRG